MALAVATLLLGESFAEADRLRKRMRRRFPTNWQVIPQSQYDLAFRATGTEATIAFHASELRYENPDPPFDLVSVELHLDNIAVVARELYLGAQEAAECDDQCSPEPPSGSRLPVLETYFDFTQANEVFLDDFAADPVGRWQSLTGSFSWEQVLPDAPEPHPGNGLSMALGGPDDDEAGVSIVVTGLEPGRTYLLTGWWYIDDEATRPVIEVEISGDVVAQPQVLLVDDDDNTPDVQDTYTAALDAFGVGYDVWDPGNADVEPHLATLAAYPVTLWFSGDKYEVLGVGPGQAGPSEEIEADHLTPYVDGGGCLLISSQDYLWDRGLPGGIESEFMEEYLGMVNGFEEAQVSVEGGPASFFAGLGPWDLAAPPGFELFTDTLIPDPISTAHEAFRGLGSTAATYKEVETEVSPFQAAYRTLYMGFPVEVVNDPIGRTAILARALKLCDLTCPWAVDYHLHLSGAVSGVRQACRSIVVLGATISGVTSLVAETAVALGDGTVVEPDAELTIELRPAEAE